MQALQWALDHPAQVERAVLVCVSAPSERAEHRVDRRRPAHAIMGDPDFQEGDYLDGPRRPRRGLSIARKSGTSHTCRRESMRRKFDRRPPRRA